RVRAVPPVPPPRPPPVARHLRNAAHPRTLRRHRLGVPPTPPEGRNRSGAPECPATRSAPRAPRCAVRWAPPAAAPYRHRRGTAAPHPHCARSGTWRSARRTSSHSRPSPAHRLGAQLVLVHPWVRGGVLRQGGGEQLGQRLGVGDLL